ncbi:NAD-dependent succinate-semialdehyde dehydrogenase [Effusibacillus pohliae]|uniref:NAD-dependent succinate-semialdehyde dehydrogenase n=1 Tax=Effusibacillus pohliae TaxID=232270 RepID=UPI00037A5ED9|nr:NAD-dependent succinate-semialdehyde dehydrogenase [Effusibacillus pohliae]
MENRLYINGEWRDAAERRQFPVVNPATGQVIAHVADATADDAQAAVEAAVRAFRSWSKETARTRSDLLYKWYHLIAAHADELADLITTEQGKPLREAKGEVLYGADFVLWYAEEAKRVYGDLIPASSPTKRLQVLHQPVGPVVAITPWNFPAAMITRKIAPALAAGCTVIVKPSEETPLTAIRLVELAAEAGFPKGVLNLVTSSDPRQVGEVLLGSPLVRKITFTGSTEVGKLLMRQAADSVKRVSLELGGHAPFLVFADADLDKAVDGVIASKFRNAGQTCVCANRILVEESILAEFTEKFRAKVERMKVGQGHQEGVEIGPLINQAAVEKVERHIQDALQKGARLVCGGRRLQGSGYENGHFFEPTILAGVTDDMLISREETFGPVAPIYSFRTEEEAVELANHPDYGLAAYMFTSDLGRTVRVSENLEFGIVGVNDPLPAVAQAPFGGYKQSGLGREGGKYGLEEFLETKYVSIQI